MVDGYYAIKIALPPTKSRMIFFKKQEEQVLWQTRLLNAMGFQNIYDFYEDLNHLLGKGEFGSVKLAKNKKNGELVAIKELKKKNMSHMEVFQTRREIEVLKICKHPNIISLLDLFENNDYYYMVIEYMKGADLFDYLEARSFNIPEERVKEIAY